MTLSFPQRTHTNTHTHIHIAKNSQTLSCFKLATPKVGNAKKKLNGSCTKFHSESAKSLIDVKNRVNIADTHTCTHAHREEARDV